MRLAILTLAALLVPVAAVAQIYATPTEPPRTTDPAALKRSIVRREIHERFQRGLAAEARGDWSAAVPEFRRAVALEPAEPQGSTALYDLALAEAHLHHDREAMRLFEAALARDPGFAAAAANVVGVALDAGDVARARAAAERFVRIAPAGALALYDAGLTALRAGDYGAARESFRALIAADSKYAVAHYDLGLAEVRREQLDAALGEFQAALNLSPHYARARFALASVLLRLGRRDEARGELERCAKDAVDPSLQAIATDLRAQIK